MVWMLCRKGNEYWENGFSHQSKIIPKSSMLYSPNSTNAVCHLYPLSWKKFDVFSVSQHDI